MAERRHLHRRTERARPAGGPALPDKQLHHPKAAHPTPSPGRSSFRRHARRRILLRPGASRTSLARRPRGVKETPMSSSSTHTDRWNALDFGPPTTDGDEPADPVLLQYTGEGAVAII